MACEVLKMNHSCEKVEIFPKVSFAAETDRQQIIKGSEEYNFLPSFGSEKLLTYQTTYRTMFGVGARERDREQQLCACAHRLNELRVKGQWRWNSKREN